MAARIRRYVGQQHVGLVALCIAVIGVPTAWALGKNSVDSKQIKPGAVHESDIADNAVTGAKVKNGSLSSSDFDSQSLIAGPQGLQGPEGRQGPEGPQGPAGPVNLCRPGPITIQQTGAGAPTQTLCTDGPISILGRCETLVTGGPIYVAARLQYATTVNDAVRVGDVDFDVADSPATVSPALTNSQTATNPVTADFGISAGGHQLVGTLLASAVSTNTGTGTGSCQFTAFGG